MYDSFILDTRCIVATDDYNMPSCLGQAHVQVLKTRYRGSSAQPTSNKPNRYGNNPIDQ